MTAMNFVNTGERAYLMTDGAAIDHEGRIVSIGMKARQTSAFPAVLMTSGPANWVDMFEAWMVDPFVSIDDLAENGETMFLATFRPWIEEKGGAGIGYYVLVAGWSEKNRAVRSVVFWDSGDVGFKADETWWITPFPESADTGAAFIRAGREGGFDPIRHGMPLMEAQRLKRKAADGFADEQHFVGGHVVLTEIGAAGIEQRIVHTWPEDRVGERIRPKPVLDPVQHPNVSSIVGLNRAARRRLAKQGMVA